MIIVVGCKVLLLVLSSYPSCYFQYSIVPPIAFLRAVTVYVYVIAASPADLFELNNVVARNEGRFCGNERFLNKHGVTSCI